MRRATCRCGQLSVECDGEPVRVSVCHCLDCQQRSGSVFAAQARFPRESVRVAGESREWTHAHETGPPMVFSFCPHCGSTVLFSGRPDRDLVAIPVGAFADPDFPSPHYSVYEDRKHRWLEIAGEGIEHYE